MVGSWRRYRKKTGMISIVYSKFEAVISKGLLSHNSPVVVFTGMQFNSNNDLISLGHKFGVFSIDGVNTNSNSLEDGCIHVVTNRKSPALDPFGNRITSTTNDEFELHTDEYFAVEPSRFVFLLCSTQSSSGGESTVALLDTVLEGVSKNAIELLQEKVFPSQVGNISILAKKQNSFIVRFNYLELQRSIQGQYGSLTSQKHLDAIDEFRLAASKRQVQFKLWPGDCLAIRNDQVLHGRLGYNADESRILKRLRVK
jgi:alpha-ketoglutarate-dependent taurine dioxygenase